MGYSAQKSVQIDCEKNVGVTDQNGARRMWVW